MSLTIPPGPLSGSPGTEVNYTIDGPKHRLYAHPFPRRVRAEFNGVTVLDTERGHLLHETGLQPVLYAPVEDVRQDLLEPTGHHTHCPFKGDASYWSIRVDGKVAENAVWGYPEPKAEAPWLAGLQAFYWDRVDAWYDEEERVYGHLRDPYHRVDVRRTGRTVRVTSRDGQVLAESSRALLLSETGLPNRYYLPPEDVRTELLSGSDTHTHCPYKGDASYRSLGELADVVWEYPEPFAEAARIKGYLSFYPEKVTIEVK